MKIFVLASLAVIGGLAACNEIGDTNYCVVGYDSNSPRRDCPFGPPPANGVTSNSNCKKIDVDPKGADCKISWATDVWPALSGSCALGGPCHDAGGKAGTPPYLPASDPAMALAGLQQIKLDCGGYVDADDPGASQILANFAGDPGAGTKMPEGPPLDATVIASITTWIKCGTPK